MKTFCGAFFALFLSGAAMADIARPEAIEDTLSAMAEAYRASDAFETVTIDHQDLSIKLEREGDEAYTSYPDNLHLELQNADSDSARQEMLDQFIAAMVDAATRAPDTPSADIIVPLVRSADFAGSIAAEDGPVSDPLAGDLSVFYAFDFPSSFSYVNAANLEDLGIDRLALADLAWDNFQARGWAPELEGDGIWFLTFDGNFEATFLLNDAMWSGFDEQLGTVLMLPLARDLILFTDAEFDGAESELRAIATDQFDQVSYPLSQTVFEWTTDGWVVR